MKFFLVLSAVLIGLFCTLLAVPLALIFNMPVVFCGSAGFVVGLVVWWFALSMCRVAAETDEMLGMDDG